MLRSSRQAATRHPMTSGRFFCLAVLLVPVAVASCSSGSSDSKSAAQSSRRVTSSPMHTSVIVPRSWSVDRPGLGYAAAPSIRTWFEKYFVDESCASRADFTAVGVLIEPGSTGAPNGAFPQRPKVVTRTSGTGVVSGGSDLACGQRAQFVQFTDNGRQFRVSIFLGKNATKQATAQAYEVVNSLKVESGP
jgi:hypothetical protein